MRKFRYTKQIIAMMLILMMVVMLNGCNQPQEEIIPTETPTEDLSYLELYKDYVQSVLDANYHGDHAAYMQITGANKEQASKMTEAHAVNMAQQMSDLYAIQLSKIPAVIGERLTEVGRQIYKAASYTVDSVEKSGETVYVMISVSPLKFYEGAAEGVEAFIDSFNERAKQGEFELMSESEYENAYAEGILAVLEETVKDIECESAKSYRIKIRYNAETGVNYIADEDMDAIDKLILADWEG